MSLRRYSEACWDPHGILHNLLLTKEMPEQINKWSAHRLAWLIIPFPFSIGITEVDEVLKDIARPLAVYGEEGGDGRLL
jgi:hypothetical protein